MEGEEATCLCATVIKDWEGMEGEEESRFVVPLRCCLSPHFKWRAVSMNPLMDLG